MLLYPQHKYQILYFLLVLSIIFPSPPPENCVFLTTCTCMNAITLIKFTETQVSFTFHQFTDKPNVQHMTNSVYLMTTSEIWQTSCMHAMVSSYPLSSWWQICFTYDKCNQKYNNDDSCFGILKHIVKSLTQIFTNLFILQERFHTLWQHNFGYVHTLQPKRNALTNWAI